MFHDHDLFCISPTSTSAFIRLLLASSLYNMNISNFSRKEIILAICLLIFVSYIYKYLPSLSTYKWQIQVCNCTPCPIEEASTTEARPLIVEPGDADGSEAACILPKLDPWAEEIMKWIRKPKPLNCSEKMPILFTSDLTTLFPVKKEIDRLGYTSCCYQSILRPPGEDSKFKFSPKCIPVSLENGTIIPVQPENEFISIRCGKKGKKMTDIVDMHAFPPASIARHELKNSSHSSNVSKKKEGRLNVLVLGFDSVSRMNFIRTMPKSYEFVMRNLSAFEMKGYNRVGPYTNDNLIPMLTSQRFQEYKKCALNTNKSLEDCPSIWKIYSHSGYLTGYGEDTSSPFQLMLKGFKEPPVDFYLRPFSLAAQKHIGREKRRVYKLCAGPRLWFQVLLDYGKKIILASKSSNFNFFHFNWIGGLGHDDVNFMTFADDPLYKHLGWLKDTGNLNQTVLILIADHGIEYGEIRNTRQGNAEANLPLNYYILPPWFKDRYPKAFENIGKNSHRLVTAFDFYATLESILTMENYDDENIQKLEEKLKGSKPPRGISLFLPIPLNRTCEDADVHQFYCSCGRKTVAIPIEDEIVKKAAEAIVTDLNNRIVKDKAEKKCAKLTLKNIIAAYRRLSGRNGEIEDGLIITLETTPGNGIFEAVVKKSGNKLVVNSDTFRTNAYGNQSHCVVSRFSKMYCYCIKQI